MNYKDVIWEHQHYRFGLAGEGQADVIQGYLEARRGRVLYIGCGPRIEILLNVNAHCSELIAADKDPRCIELLNKSAMLPSGGLCRMDANQLGLKYESVDFILALGLFAHVLDPESVFREFYRVCRGRGYAMITNSVAHPAEVFVKAGERIGFRLAQQEVGYCPAASGNDKRRYLLVFSR